MVCRLLGDEMSRRIPACAGMVIEQSQFFNTDGLLSGIYSGSCALLMT